MSLVAQMAKVVTIDLARDFSAEPFGRYMSHGPASGERFRSEFLERHLRAGDQVVVNIDGVTGLSSSFLDEAFAGLVRRGVVPADRFFDVVKIISERDPSYIEDIKLYVDEATAH
jgi:hypothetical protein